MILRYQKKVRVVFDILFKWFALCWVIRNFDNYITRVFDVTRNKLANNDL